MQFKSKQPKPPTGMEMAVTLMMPADQSPEESRNALLKFFEAMTSASNEIGSAWMKIKCAGIPEELETALQGAFDTANKCPNLTLVVDNNSPTTP